jgi:hypothetical protein
MYSILRPRKALVAGLLAGMLFGCQHVQRIAPPEPLQPPLQSADPAMQLRQWDPTIATYASGGVWAWPNYVEFAPKTNNEKLRGVLETDFFLINIAYSPIAALITDPMWKKVYYQQLTMEPSYTASPPLPPSTQPSIY